MLHRIHGPGHREGLGEGLHQLRHGCAGSFRRAGGGQPAPRGALGHHRHGHHRAGHGREGLRLRRQRGLPPLRHGPDSHNGRVHSDGDTVQPRRREAGLEEVTQYSHEDLDQQAAGLILMAAGDIIALYGRVRGKNIRDSLY